MTDERRSISPLRLILAGAVLLGMVGGLLTALFLFGPGARTLELPTGSATVLNPPQQLEPFMLTGTDGEPTGLETIRGNYTLLSFGYTHCPDVCPLTLTEYRRVKRELGEASADVNFVFISVDGERDSPDLLGRYLERFDPAFIGMTTTDETLLKAVTSDFNVFYERRVVGGTAASYLVDHTATTFLLNPRGQVIALYPFGTPPVDIAADIASLL
jgi:protein SCO1/2